MATIANCHGILFAPEIRYPFSNTNYNISTRFPTMIARLGHRVTQTKRVSTIAVRSECFFSEKHGENVLTRFDDQCVSWNRLKFLRIPEKSSARVTYRHPSGSETCGTLASLNPCPSGGLQTAMPPSHSVTTTSSSRFRTKEKIPRTRRSEDELPE